jgi:hypothetical protein
MEKRAAGEFWNKMKAAPATPLAKQELETLRRIIWIACNKNPTTQEDEKSEMEEDVDPTVGHMPNMPGPGGNAGVPTVDPVSNRVVGPEWSMTRVGNDISVRQYLGTFFQGIVDQIRVGHFSNFVLVQIHVGHNQLVYYRSVMHFPSGMGWKTR